MICCGFFLIFSFLLTCLHWFYSTISLSFHQLVKNFSSFLSNWVICIFDSYNHSASYLKSPISSSASLATHSLKGLNKMGCEKYSFLDALPCLSSVLVSPCLNNLSFCWRLLFCPFSQKQFSWVFLWVSSNSLGQKFSASQ